MSALPAELVATHRQAIVNLSDLVYADVLKVWKLVSAGSANDIRDALLQVVPEIANTRGESAAALAADFYEDAREEMVARGKWRALLPDAVSPARVESLVRWGVDPLYGPVQDEPATFSRIAGELQKVVANQARRTIETNSTHDRSCYGWSRVTAAGCCDFCSMLAGRGAVYSKATVTFASHGDCQCGAVPAFRPGRPLSVEQYTASKRNKTAKDRERVRDYLKGTRSEGHAAARRPEGFNAMTRDRLEHLISVTSDLPDSDYKAGYLAKLNARLTDLQAS